MESPQLSKGATLIQVSISVAILLVAGSIAYYFLYFLPQQTHSAVSQPTATQTQPAPVEQPAAPTGFQVTNEQIGQPVVVNNVQYTVVSGTDLGSDLSKYPQNGGMGQSNGGTFILVKFIADNLGTAEASVQNTTFLVSDSAHREYLQQGESLTNYISYSVPGYSMLDQQSYQPTALEPGIPTKLFILVEAPAGDSGLGMVIANQQNQNYFIPLGL